MSLSIARRATLSSLAPSTLSARARARFSRRLSYVAAEPALDLPAQFVAVIHASTAAPWWASICGSVLLLRLSLLPLVSYQLRETQKMAQMRPALLAIRHECSYLSPAPRRAWATASRMYKHCRAASVQPLALIVAPLVQIPILVYSVVSIRRMTQPGSPYEAELKQGGPTVHRDLTKPDSSWALPLASVAFLLANLQLSMPSSASTLFVTVRNLWQAIALVAIPVFAELPAGMRTLCLG